ncbi:hypothetical protein BC835DRAFT_1304751 [Cytidiella melzeri]|nr:hypothetical protein BC835DRAFT_1304751 [Cytidiella melzeri]
MPRKRLSGKSQTKELRIDSSDIHRPTEVYITTHTTYTKDVAPPSVPTPETVLPTNPGKGEEDVERGKVKDKKAEATRKPQNSPLPLFEMEEISRRKTKRRRGWERGRWNWGLNEKITGELGTLRNKLVLKAKPNNGSTTILIIVDRKDFTPPLKTRLSFMVDKYVLKQSHRRVRELGSWGEDEVKETTTMSSWDD